MADEYIRLDTTIMGIDGLINEAPTGSQARVLFCAKDMIYDQQRYVSEMKPVKRGNLTDEETEIYNKRIEAEAADVQPVKRELVKIVDSDFMTQGYLTIEKFYSCPRCGETFGNVRFSRRSQLAEMYKYCYKCGQGLDWADATKG